MKSQAVVAVFLYFIALSSASPAFADRESVEAAPDICHAKGSRCFPRDLVKCCKGLKCEKPGPFVRDYFCSEAKCLAESNRCLPLDNKCCKGLECRKPAPYARDYFCSKPKCFEEGKRCDPLAKSCCKGLECKKRAPFTRDSFCTKPTKCLNVKKRCFPRNKPGCCRGLECRKRAPFTRDYFCLLPKCLPRSSRCSPFGNGTRCCPGLSCRRPVKSLMWEFDFMCIDSTIVPDVVTRRRT